MSGLTSEQEAALAQVYDAKSLSDLDKALKAFEKTLPETDPAAEAGTAALVAERERIAEALIEQLEPEQPAKKLNRLLTMLATVDGPKAAEIVAKYASNQGTPEVDDRIQAWALISLSRMSAYEDTCSLLHSTLDDENTKSRIRALALRLLIQCGEGDLEIRGKICKQLLEMGRGQNADHRWATLRALRYDENLEPLSADVEQKVITELAAPAVKDDFEWQDVRIQAALVLGDVRTHVEEAMVQLSLAFNSSTIPLLRRHCIESMSGLAERMKKEQRDSSPYNTVMLAALDDDSADVRSRAFASLKKVLKRQAAIELIVDHVLQSEEPSDGQLAALRNIDLDGAIAALRAYLFHRDPVMVQRASLTLTNLGGDEAFGILFAQREQAVNKYTKMLATADKRIMKQYNILMFQARRAFWISMSMHSIIFLLGAVVFLVTISLGLRGKLEWGPLFSGLGSGTFAMGLSLFYRNPLEEINTSVTSLVKVNVAFLGYMRQVNQIDATFKQLFLDTAGFTTAKMKETVNEIQQAVDQSLDRIQTYLVIDDSASSGELKAGIRQGIDEIISREDVREGITATAD